MEVSIYLLTMTGGRRRRSETYIGGERLDEVYIRGVAPAPDRHVEVTGTDFYKTLEEMPGLRRLYGLARAKWLDISEVGATATFYFVALLRRAHTDALPLYVVWLLAGLLVVLYAMTQFGP